MIRINLLPFRLARKKENIRRQVSIFFLSIAFVVMLLVWYTLGVDREILETRTKTKAVKVQIALYKEKADRVNAIKRKIKILDDKLKIVKSLKTRRNEQQTLLEEVADRIVPERMWIEKLKSDSVRVTIKGIAFDNPTIADFMRNLEGSPLFSNIDLKRSKIKTFKGDVDLKSFELICTKKKAAPAKKKKGKKGKK